VKDRHVSVDANSNITFISDFVYPSIYLPACLPACLPTIYLPTSLLLTKLLTYLTTHTPTHLPTHPPTYLPANRGSRDGMATPYRLDKRAVGIRVPESSRMFTLPYRPFRKWGSTNLLCTGYWGFPPGDKAGGA
jgi:hypothetical protein